MFLTIHVALSLIGILAGFVVVFTLLGGKQSMGWTPLFLATTALTSITGFFLPATHLMPSHIIGIISLVVLAIAIAALYTFHLVGGWRRAHVIASVLALYFNVFVLVAQGFRRVPALKELAPTQTEPPFLIAQVIVMAVFITLGVLATKRFRAIT